MRDRTARMAIFVLMLGCSSSSTAPGPDAGCIEFSIARCTCAGDFLGMATCGSSGAYGACDCSSAGGDAATSCPSYYLDRDGDGFGGAAPVVLCEPPANAVTNHSDCDDNDVRAFPGQTLYFSTPMSGLEADGGVGSLDFNCDGIEEAQYPNIVSCTYEGESCIGTSGFYAINVGGVLQGEVPGCGASGLFATCADETCANDGTGCGTSPACIVPMASSLPTTTQSCH